MTIEAAKQLLAQTEINNFELWVDDQGRARRTVLDMFVAGTAAEFDMKMWDFDEPISISAPEEFIEINP